MSETNPTLVGRVPGFSQEYPTLELAIADSMRDGEHAIFTIQTGDEVEVKLENGAVQYVTVSKKRLEGIVREAGMLAVMLRVFQRGSDLMRPVPTKRVYGFVWQADGPVRKLDRETNLLVQCTDRDTGEELPHEPNVIYM